MLPQARALGCPPQSRHSTPENSKRNIETDGFPSMLGPACQGSKEWECSCRQHIADGHPSPGASRSSLKFPGPARCSPDRLPSAQSGWQLAPRSGKALEGRTLADGIASAPQTLPPAAWGPRGRATCPCPCPGIRRCSPLCKTQSKTWENNLEPGPQGKENLTSPGLTKLGGFKAFHQVKGGAPIRAIT